MKKYIGLLLTALLLISLPLTIFAEETVWSFEENYSKLTDGEKIYKRVSLPYDCEFNPNGAIHIKSEDLEHMFGEAFIVTTDSNDSIVYAIDYYSLTIFDVYASKDTDESLTDFYNGNYSSYRVRFFSDFEFDYCYLDLPNDALDSFTDRKSLSIDASKLLYSEVYEVLGFDENDCLSHTCGAVYRYNEKLYYVDYDSLDNSHFTSDGEFSYRSGKVDMALIETNTEVFDIINRLEADGEPRVIEFRSGEDYYIDFAGSSSGIFFWVGIAIVGYVIPCVPFIFGLILPHTKKHGYTKRWYVLSILSLLWIVLTTAIILILLL